MTERRNHWILGLSPANIIVLLTIVVTASVAWGVQISTTGENTTRLDKIEVSTKLEMKEMEGRIKSEIIQSEERTNARMERMEKRIEKRIDHGMNAIEQAILGNR